MEQGGTGREMTLKEWVGRLMSSHFARREYDALLDAAARLAEVEAELDTWREAATEWRETYREHLPGDVRTTGNLGHDIGRILSGFDLALHEVCADRDRLAKRCAAPEEEPSCPLHVIEIRVGDKWEPTPDVRTSEARAHLRMEWLRQRYPSHEYRVREWVRRGP